MNKLMTDTSDSTPALGPNEVQSRDSDHDRAVGTDATMMGRRASRSALQAVSRAMAPRRISAIYLGAAFVIFFSIHDPTTFPTRTTVNVVLGAGVVTCMMGLAFLVPLTAEAYDLSVGAVMALSLTIVVKLSLSTALPMPLVAVMALLACGVVGFLNGLLVVRFHINSFIATIGTTQVLLAVVLLVSDNSSLLGDFPAYWSELGNNSIVGNIPITIIYLLVLASIIWYVLEFTRVGTYLSATGGNPVASRLSGVRTDRYLVGSLTVSAVIAGMCGVIYSMQVGQSSSTVGAGLLFPAVTAVFFGAAQFSGRPNVWGTMVAFFALAIGVQGLTLSVGSAASWAAPLFEGVALITAVGVASRVVAPKLMAARVGMSQSDKDALLSEGSARHVNDL